MGVNLALLEIGPIEQKCKYYLKVLTKNYPVQEINTKHFLKEFNNTTLSIG